MSAPVVRGSAYVTAEFEARPGRAGSSWPMCVQSAHAHAHSPVPVAVRCGMPHGRICCAGSNASRVVTAAARAWTRRHHAPSARRRHRRQLLDQHAAARRLREFSRAHDSLPLRVLCKARRWPHASPPSLSLSLECWLRTAVRCDNAKLVSLHGAETPLRARQVVSVVFVESDATWLVFASASVRWLCTYGRTAPLGGPSVVVPVHPPVRQQD